MALLNHSNWEVYPLSHQMKGYKNEVIVDFCTSEFLEVLNKLPKVDVVIHLGNKVGWGQISNVDLFNPNVLVTAELVNWAKKMGAYFIFTSAALIAGIEEQLITPNLPPNSDHPYLYSKFLAEELIKMSGINYSILRISGIFGLNGPSHLGINNAISQALKGEIPVLYGDGRIRRNYIFVEDLCKILQFCMEERPEGTYLIGGAQVNTMIQMLESICRIFLPGFNPKIYPNKDGYDQVVEVSDVMPSGRSFEEALINIKERAAEE